MVRILVVYPWQTCPLACQFCQQREQAAPAHGLSWWQELLRHYRQLGGRQFLVSGGEPLVDPEACLTLIACGAEAGLHPNVSTSGYIPRDVALVVARRLASLRCRVNVALHAWGPLHDRIVQTEGAFETTMATIQILRQASCSTLVISVVTPEAVSGNELRHVARFAKSVRCEGIWLAYPWGRKSPRLSPEAYAECVAQVRAEADGYPVFSDDLGTPAPLPGNVASVGLHVFQDGSVFACPVARGATAPLARMRAPTDLSDLVKRLRRLELRDGRCELCENCVQNATTRMLTSPRCGGRPLLT